MSWDREGGGRTQRTLGRRGLRTDCFSGLAECVRRAWDGRANGRECEAFAMPVSDIMNLVNRWPYVGELGVVMKEQPTTALILRWRCPFRKGSNAAPSFPSAFAWEEKNDKPTHPEPPPKRAAGDDPSVGGWHVDGVVEQLGRSRVDPQSEVAPRWPTSYGVHEASGKELQAQAVLCLPSAGGMPFWRWIGEGGPCQRLAINLRAASGAGLSLSLVCELDGVCERHAD